MKEMYVVMAFERGIDGVVMMRGEGNGNIAIVHMGRELLPVQGASLFE